MILIPSCYTLHFFETMENVPSRLDEVYRVDIDKS